MNPFPRLLQIQPARASGARDLPALETALAGLALDERSPIALELAATDTTRHFFLRADQTVALQHLERQVQARYPQAVITPALSDPLTLAPGEECSAIELCPGAASYLPLRSWKAREMITEGTDPLLGILAAFGSLLVGRRAVAQLALLPASPTWSASNRRYAVEHPLQREYAQARGSKQEHSIKDVLFLLPPVLFFLLLYLLHGLIPHWLIQIALELLHGQSPHLTGGEAIELIVGGGILFLLLLGGAYGGILLLSRLGSTRIYDQHLAEEKTARPAYRVRLRLFVIAPGTTCTLAAKQGGAEEEEATPQRWWGHRTLVWFRCLPMRLRVWGGSGKILFRRANLAQVWEKLCTNWQVRRVLSQASRARRLEREDLLRPIAAAYRQYHLTAGGYFLPRRLSTRHVRRLLAPPTKGWIRRSGWAYDLPRSAHYLSVADLAALWHLPQAQDLPDLAFVERAEVRTALAPAVLSAVSGYQLGTSTHAGQTLPVCLPFGCLRQNLLAAASTGKGKSSLFAHLLLAFAQARVLKHPEAPDGALLIDPHGDLAAQVAGLLPSELADDVILINLADRDYPFAFNPLDMSGDKDRDKIIDNLIQVIESLWPTSYGPRTESFLEYSCKTLTEANAAMIADDPLNGAIHQYTLLDVVPLLRRTSFRNAVLERVSDPHLLNWWHQYYELLDARQQADFTSSLITKVSKFSSSRIISRILGQPCSTLDLNEIIRQNKIVLFSCASGEVGADMAALFGSLFVGFFQAALQEQARLHPAERHRFLVVIDEFQALAGINYQVMLAELRKYGGSFALATQSLAYLDRFERTLRATVLANVEHIFAFAMADEDARLLHLPGIEPDDIAQLPNYTCYARLSLDGTRLPVFSLRLSEPKAANDTQRQHITARCRTHYCHPVGEVDLVLRECQARQEGIGAGESIWAGAGVETVAEVVERIRKRKRGRGSSKKAEKQGEMSVEGQAEEAQPLHLMYARQDDIPHWSPGEAGEKKM